MSAIADQEDMGLPLYEKFGFVKMKKNGNQSTKQIYKGRS